MAYYIIKRNDINGRAGCFISLDEEGKPFYVYPPNNVKQGVRFCRRSDAEYYKEYCKKNMGTIKGQKDFEVVKIKTKGILGWFKNG